jgi:hypothetical protein
MSTGARPLRRLHRNLPRTPLEKWILTPRRPRTSLASAASPPRWGRRKAANGRGTQGGPFRPRARATETQGPARSQGTAGAVARATIAIQDSGVSLCGLRPTNLDAGRRLTNLGRLREWLSRSGLARSSLPCEFAPVKAGLGTSIRPPMKGLAVFSQRSRG